MKLTKAPKPRRYGVFCLENWSSRLTNRQSVQPLLELAEREAGLRYVHRQVRGAEDFLDYLAQWAAGYAPKLGYFACHGDVGTIWLGRDELSIQELGQEMKTRRIDCTGRILYFGSCATLGVSPAKLDQVLDDSRAAAVCGYRHEEGVFWLESAAFELLLLDQLSDSPFRSAPYQLRELRKAHPQLVRRLGFTFRPLPAK